MTLASFERLIASLNRAQDGWLHFARGGVKAIPVDMVDSQGLLELRKIRNAFADGETLYLTKAERLSRPLMELARSIEIELGLQGFKLRESVNAHVFLTPPRSQGFPLHRDEHASFIIQLEGCKEWTIYEPIGELESLRNQLHIPGSVDLSSLKPFKAHTYRMQRGDVLYMPEWWPHEAKAADSHSLHVTIRMFPLRWMDLMLEMCSSHPALAGTLPRETSDGLRTTLDQILSILDSSTFRDALPPLLESSMRTHVVPKSVLPDDGFRQVLEVDRIELSTRLVRSAGTVCEVFETGGQICIGFPGGIIRGPMSVKEVFRYVAEKAELRAQDLPAIREGEYDRLEVVRTLVRDGLLHIPQSSRL